jgi:protein-disulfide isomerase
MRPTLLFVALAMSWQTPLQDTSNQLDQILKELRQIRTLLEAGPTAGGGPNGGTQTMVQPMTTVEVGSAPYIGSPTAAVTIVEFTDFQCSFCNRFFLDTLPALKKTYIDSGKVRFYSMDHPLAIHSNALRAAQAGRCANDQGRFWQMHDLLQANPQRLELSNLWDYARDARLNLGVFRQCVESEKYKKTVEDKINEGLAIGVRGTPTFVVGRSTPSGVEGTMFLGAEPFARFDKLIQDLLKAAAADNQIQPEKGQ